MLYFYIVRRVTIGHEVDKTRERPIRDFLYMYFAHLLYNVSRSVTLVRPFVFKLFPDRWNMKQNNPFLLQTYLHFFQTIFNCLQTWFYDTRWSESYQWNMFSSFSQIYWCLVPTIGGINNFGCKGPGSMLFISSKCTPRAVTNILL